MSNSFFLWEGEIHVWSFLFFYLVINKILKYCNDTPLHFNHTSCKRAFSTKTYPYDFLILGQRDDKIQIMPYKDITTIR